MEKDNRMERRFGFPTALAMVVGIVIGSGIFFKAVKVLKLTGGNMKDAMIVIAAVGCICMVCSLFFAKMGREYAHCNGLVDYAEATLGKTYGYLMGWFLAMFYYPIIGATLSYIAASYVSMMFGLEMYGQTTTGIAVFFMLTLSAANMLAPKLGGKLQVTTTVIKLIPLVLMSVVGLAVGIVNGNSIEALRNISQVSASSGNGIFAGICAFAFSYEGWISATAINSELKNPKRDLPLALIIGSIFCTVLYMSYVFSMTATLSVDEIMAAGDMLPVIAFGNVFGNFVASIILVFIIISCLGTANGMIMCTLRGLYALSVRNMGPRPDVLSEVDKSTGMPLKCSIIGIGLMGFWLFQTSTLFFQGPLAFNGTGNPEWLLAWEADEICIITLYAMYIPMFIHIMIHNRDFNVLYRFILPLLSIASSLFMCYSSYVSYGKQILYYLVFYAAIMGIGLCFMHPKRTGHE